MRCTKRDVVKNDAHSHIEPEVCKKKQVQNRAWHAWELPVGLIQFVVSAPVLLCLGRTRFMYCSLPVLFTCSLPVLYLFFTCSLPVLYLFFSCSLPVLCLFSTCFSLFLVLVLAPDSLSVLIGSLSVNRLPWFVLCTAFLGALEERWWLVINVNLAGVSFGSSWFSAMFWIFQKFDCFVLGFVFYACHLFNFFIFFSCFQKPLKTGKINKEIEQEKTNRKTQRNKTHLTTLAPSPLLLLCLVCFPLWGLVLYIWFFFVNRLSVWAYSLPLRTCP